VGVDFFAAIGIVYCDTAFVVPDVLGRQMGTDLFQCVKKSASIFLKFLHFQHKGFDFLDKFKFALGSEFSKENF